MRNMKRSLEESPTAATCLRSSWRRCASCVNQVALFLGPEVGNLACERKACPHKMLDSPLLSKPCDSKLPGDRDQCQMDAVLFEQSHGLTNAWSEVGLLEKVHNWVRDQRTIPPSHLFYRLPSIF